MNPLTRYSLVWLCVKVSGGDGNALSQFLELTTLHSCLTILSSLPITCFQILLIHLQNDILTVDSLLRQSMYFGI